MAEAQITRLGPLLEDLLSLPKIPVTPEPIDLDLLRSYTIVLGQINKALHH